VIKACGVAKKTEVCPKDYHPPDENSFQKEESNFAYGDVLVKNSEYHFLNYIEWARFISPERDTSGRDFYQGIVSRNLIKGLS
jgi:hypothetical protein